ncbi:MAG TPA: hypothetical protein VIC55_02775 [Gemmatimonadaceae bacterium]
MTIVRTFAVFAALSMAVGAAAQQSGGGSDSSTRAGVPSHDTVISADTAPLTALPDQNRGIDAELRTALFELTSDRPLAAVARLEWLRTMADSTHPRPDLLFLLGESYYRLGMGAKFRATASALSGVPGAEPYMSVINGQLMLDAYRRGDDATVRALAVRNPGGDRGLVSLVYGLAAYRGHDWTTARGAFATARAEGGVYAPYGQYMEALTSIAGDTTHAAAALDALRPMTNVATGPFGDQVRLTAAEVAFEAGQYDAAAGYAAGVSPTSGLAAQALLTQAWALYRAGRADSSRASFAAFASRFPNLPERDDARLMLGQAMLESGHTADASTYFELLADSVGVDLAVMQGRSPVSLANAAHALVQARGAGLAFLADPRSGKTLALPDDTDADAATILAGYGGVDAPPTHVLPQVVSVLDVEARADSLVPALGADFPRRLLYAPVSSPAVFATYSARAEALSGADAAVVLDRYRLQQQLDAQVMRVAALEDLQHLTASSRADLEEGEKTLVSLQDSITHMSTALDRARTRVHDMLALRVSAVQAMAAENAHLIDSLRTSLGPDATSAESDVLNIESQTAAIYARVADSVSHQLNAVVARQPTFMLRDSINARLVRARALHDETQRVLAVDDSLVTRELATLRTVESERVRAARASLAQAETERAAAEAQMVQLVDGELRTRAASLLAALQHDREAADYGSASAAFFRALELSGTAGDAAGPAPNGSATPSPR